jgi:YQGE family putative transporter
MMRVKEWLSDFFNLNRMSADFRKLSLMHASFMIFLSLNAVYINTLLVRANPDLRFVMSYNLMNFIFTPIASAIAVVFLKKIDVRKVTVIGLIFYTITYLCVLIFIEQLEVFMPVIAILNSIAGGFYFITLGIFMSNFTDETNSDLSLSFTFLYSSVISLAIPALSGYVISLFSDKTGYYLIVIIAFLITILTIYLAFRISQVKYKIKRSYIFYSLRESFINKSLRQIYFANLSFGLREGVFMFFLSVLLFQIVENEALVGINVLATSLIGIITSYISSKKLNSQNRVNFMIIANIILFASGLILFIKLNIISIFVLSLVNAFCNVFLVIPPSTIFFGLLNKSKHSEKINSERFLIKDIYLNLGRAIGVVFVMVMPSTNLSYTIAIVILILTQFITVWLCKKAEKSLKS